VKTCSILTATPNAVTSAVHNRMPVRPLEAEAGIRSRDAVDAPGRKDILATICLGLLLFDVRQVQS